MKPSLLVIEDEESIRELLRMYFERQGFSVSTAGTGREALDFLRVQAADLALLDVLLPDFDGIELLRELRQSQPRMPVIIMTGAGSDSRLRAAAEAAGAQGFVNKTLPLPQLIEVVQKVLRP